VNWKQEEKGFLGFKDPSSAISLPFERKKAKDAAPTGAIRKIGLFCCHLKEGLIK
jgi:hypothetical protein